MLVLEARNIHKSYRTAQVVTPVLHGIDLSLRKGEFAVIMGPSGCGKSTLLHVLGLMCSADRVDSLRIEGIETRNLGPAQRTLLRREKIGFVFQRFNLIHVLSAADNLRLALKIGRIASNGQVERMLDVVGLSDKADRKPGQLSIGEQQRLAIARAVVRRPTLLLADEPTGNLDSANAGSVLDLIKRCHALYGQTTLMITHNPDLADCADRVYTMRDGRIVGG